MASLTLKHVDRAFPNGYEAVKDLNFQIEDGEFVILTGPSGSGKSAVMRMIAGLESITDGEMIMGGRVMNKIPPKNRDIAMVFQNYALYPNMKVKDNIAFPLKMRHTGKQETKSMVAESRKSWSWILYWKGNRVLFPEGSVSEWPWHVLW